ncbi:hypothetical protein [Arcanobacterium bovis]|uniref:Uncharacterized protein n=1 Tax=Arcanobacterium bovis TaxID=2529275 RepID=A0A4Q9V2B1_9ACTO|nr:hypothetical protein [Arcanobacterium bovis]TBW23781.1 hypothetical protein EZJ44_01195 [Arcanobacterium bovis]
MALDKETIIIAIKHEKCAISRSVFEMLLENSIAYSDSNFLDALEHGRVQFATLRQLAEKTRVPLPLFFAPEDFVKSQIKQQNDILIANYTNQTIYMNSRNSLDVRDIQLIVKDLIQKRETIKRLYKPIPDNNITGSLKRRGLSIQDDATKLSKLLGFHIEHFRSYREKEDAFRYIVELAEQSRIYVSRTQQHVMPQRITKPSFSGFLLKDRKIPYIFLANNSNGEFEEVAGRRIFTLLLLIVMLARGIYQPVALSDVENESSDSYEYDLVGEILLPKEDLIKADPVGLEEMKTLASECKVTPSMVVVRCQRVGLISKEARMQLLDELREEWENSTSHYRRNPSRWNQVLRYSGHEFTRQMFSALEKGKISRPDFLRIATLNKLTSKQISSLQEAAYGH